MSIILLADLHDNSCNTRLRPSGALPRIKLQKKGMRLRLVFTEFIWSTTSAETGTIIVSGKARQCTNRGFASIPTRLCPGLQASRLELSLRLRPPYPVAMSIIICRRIYTTTNPHWGFAPRITANTRLRLGLTEFYPEDLEAGELLMSAGLHDNAPAEASPLCLWFVRALGLRIPSWTNKRP